MPVEMAYVRPVQCHILYNHFKIDASVALYVDRLNTNAILNYQVLTTLSLLLTERNFDK